MAKVKTETEKKPKPINTQSKWAYTWHLVKRNQACYWMMLPFFALFTIFTVVPVVMSFPLGLTSFNLVQFPKFIGLQNFYSLFVNDDIFLIAIKNTLIFAIFTGPFSYVLSFLLAWLINEMNPFFKVFFTFVFYAPSMTPSAFVIWQLVFSGDSYGYLNSVLLDLGILTQAAQWLTDTTYMMTVVIIVQLWTSMGAGFLALRAGFQGIDASLYEAGAIEGIQNRFQELFTITIPAMGPSLLFAAVLAISGAFTVGGVGASLCGLPSTNYAVHTVMNHAQDYGSIRYEMGYASAICMVLFVVMLIFNKLIRNVLSKYTD
ncbi:MAG: sugar ABC transporter permease [Oscillospiraceae bacterium]|nr:sugar ABC transporter permease [Oscillospiraceae bacterium]